MIEAILVLAGVVLLAAVGLVVPLLPADRVIAAGALCTALGLVLGLPTGLWYHVRLRAVLREAGLLPARWWLHPIALHDRLPAHARAGVLRWCLAGAVGFGVTALGCGISALGVGLAVLATP